MANLHNKRKVIFVLHATGLCGGIRVICELVHHLRIRGWPVELWHFGGEPTWYKHPLPRRAFRELHEIGQALRALPPGAAKVATWWETAYWVAESLNPGDLGLYLTQDIETTYTSNPVQDEKCLNTYRLGLTTIPTSHWVEKQLRDRFGLSPHYIGLGIDFDAFRPLPMIREQYRLACPARRWSAGPRDLKGWHCARVAAARCHDLVKGMSLVTFGIEHGPKDVPRHIPHLHLHRPGDFGLRTLYSQSGVFFLSSNHEGFGLPAAEAMACGCPVVATRCNGNEEFCINGETCLTVPVGDGVAAGNAVARLMMDPELANKLGAAGREFVSRYTWTAAVQRLENVLIGG